MKLLTLIAVVVIALTLNQFRYEIVGSGSSVAYRLDRWTGDVRLLAGRTYQEVKREE